MAGVPHGIQKIYSTYIVCVFYESLPNVNDRISNPAQIVAAVYDPVVNAQYCIVKRHPQIATASVSKLFTREYLYLDASVLKAREAKDILHKIATFRAKWRDALPIDEKSMALRHIKKRDRKRILGEVCAMRNMRQ